MSGTLGDIGGLLVVAGHPAAGRVVAAGLHALQARGPLGADVAVADGTSLHVARGEGPVAQALPPEQVAHLAGGLAVGLVRGMPGQRLAMGRSRGGWGAAAVAGSLTNAVERWQELLDDGALASDGSDAELLLQLLARSRQRTFVNRLVDAVWKVQGAYTLAAITPERIVVLRDPAGFRPLWLGHMGDAVLVSSDDQAIEAIGGHLERPLRPGEMLIIDEAGVQSIAPLAARPTSVCTQEVVALAPRAGRPFAEPALAVRRRLGARLAEHALPPDATAVVAASGPAEDLAVGLAEAASLRFVPAFVPRAASPYLDDTAEEAGGAPGAVPGVVAGAVVVLVTPSLTHGHEVRRQVSDLLRAGAAAVHVRCGAPPLRLACPYGVRVHGGDVMAASRHSEAEALASWLGTHSIAWLEASDLDAVLGGGRCEACMSSRLPLDVRSTGDDQLALFAGGDQTDRPPSTRKV